MMNFSLSTGTTKGELHRSFFDSASRWRHPSKPESSLAAIFSLVLLGAVVGAAVTFRIAGSSCDEENEDESPTSCDTPCSYDPVTQRDRLPLLVILVRHGESEGNVDKSMWSRKPDHDIELTETGKQQAKDAGKRIESIFRAYDQGYSEILHESIHKGNSCMFSKEDSCSMGPRSPQAPRVVIRNVHLHVSPFLRTRQTAHYALPFFRHRVAQYLLCPRLREQEFGNLQGEEFQTYREEQKRVGRFWYRFPTGESGADVLDRVKSWWVDTFLPTNNELDPSLNGDVHFCDAVVVFTHGLTLRSILCQLFNWSVFTFHSVYNAKNCDLYVLRKDLSKKGQSPYILDGEHGNLPRSSVNLLVQTENTEKVYKLKDYLSIPSPRMTHLQVIREKLVEQYPEDFPNGSDDISSISFLPFVSSPSPKSAVNLPSRESSAKLSTLCNDEPVEAESALPIHQA